ncbi:polymorphic toxin-type HINT domain-containing protein [Streptacidiphilus carbonis]|uniref:polymorphic toxin-type HINT domain-containing protein n=1 Tax=Streptacidiphilus carbonis TaxID=105422 RepID=UPI000694178D|nr:polymorphic toxin-type HINT domain-containing protein [Streptacidiphilus carbonis]
MGATLLGPISAQAATVDPHKIWSPPNTALPRTASISGHDVGLPAATKSKYPVPGLWQPAPASTTVSGSATATLPAPTAATGGKGTDSAASVRAGTLPVWLAGRSAAGRSAGAAGAVTATVADTAHTQAAGVHGLIVSLSPGSAAASKAPVQVGLDLSSLDASYGADAAERSRLVELPACALTTPQAKGCLAATPIASHYDPATKRLVADVTLPAAAAATGPASALRSPTTGGQAQPPVVQASAIQSGTVAASAAQMTPMVLAVQTTSSGGAGTYSATSLQGSSAWASGNSSGSFTYSYPIAVPPALGGTAPQVSLTYDSSSIDGKTSATNAQASNVGDGWDVSSGGFIERSFKSCDKDGLTGSGDECWGGNVATLSLGSHSGTLVRDDTTGAWHLQGDDGTKVEFVDSAQPGNGATFGEYVKVTDPSGTVYYFGLNHLPGGDGTDPSTNSNWTVPVYSPKSGDPCYTAAQAQASWCSMPWRMNLAYAVDPHGNLTTYTYAPAATNYYSRGGGQNNGTGTLTGYTPGGSLAKINYGQTLAGQVAAKGTAAVAATVKFNLAAEGRCDTSGGFTCSGATLSSTNATHWPDVPYDQYCPSAGACTNYGPSFWTNQRLASITTQIQSAGATQQVDSYALTQSYRTPGDGTKPPLWLDSIQRTGKDGTTPITLPAVSFTPVMLANRVDGTNLVPAPAPYYRPRIQTLTTESGERLNVDYNLPACSRVNNVMPASADSDTMACFNVLWYPPGSTAGQPPASDWFNHYTVASVTANDTVAGAPSRVTSYSYGAAAWHRDDSELTDPATRTWDQFRGFASVDTVTGTGGDGPQGQTVAYYMQGMNGDVMADGSTRSAQAGAGTWSGAVTDDDWLSGQVLETDTYNHAYATGNPGSVVSYTFTRASGPVTTATHARGGSLPDLVARFATTKTVSTTESLKADGTWRTSTSTATSDSAHGNRPLTQDTTADGLPETCARTSYATSTTTQMTELADETLTVSGAGACTAVATASNTVSDSRSLYDGQPFGQALGAGDVTSKQVLKSYDGSGNPVYTTVTASTFDTYGRVASSTDPNATDSAHTGGATTTLTFKSAAAGELPTELDTVAPVPGKTTTWPSSQSFDPARGLVLTSTDINAKVTKTTYDALGRTTAVWKPGNTTTNADILYTYAVNGTTAPSSTTTATFGPKGTNRLYSIQIFNGFGEVAQTQSTPGISAYTGRMITDSYYDSQGRVVKSHAAWYNSDTGPTTTLYATNNDTQAPTETTTAYDGLGRATLSTFLSLGHAQSSTSTVYRGADETDVTPPAGSTPTTTITDAAGRTSQTWQYRTTTATGQASDADVTTTTYNAAGQVATHTDTTGKDTWTYSYDLQGRQIKAVDPDTGTTTTTYTADGQAATTTDARKQTLAYTYDLLGRKTGEYNGTVAAANELASWTYDSVTGGLGQPATATRYTGGVSGTAYSQATLGYDNAYRSTGTTTTLPGSLVGQTAALTYTTHAAYDPYSGALTASQDGAAADQPAETLNYGYDVNGPLLTYGSATTTYDLSTDWDPWGRALRTTLNPWGTEVVSTYNYDQGTGHVLSDFIDKQTALTGSVDQYNYTYNQAGQVTSVQDIPDNTPAQSDLQCFSYDYLGRLSTAWTDTGTTTVAPSPSIGGIGGCTNTSPTSGAAAGKTTVGGPAAYWTSYTYDLTGNRTGQTQHNTAGTTSKDVTTIQTFPAVGQNNTPTTAPNTGGGTGGPHALLSSTTTGTTGSTAYQYDADGNTTNITATAGTTNLTWDAEGHLASDTATGATGPTTYLYDAAGNLLVRTAPDKTNTIYLGDDVITYKAGNTPAAQDTRTYTTPNGISIIKHGTSENFEISDAHGTAALDINATTLAETRRYLDPFGNARGTTPAAWTLANGYGDKGFVGGTQDPTTGLTNLGAREYQPATGRFLNVDPLFNSADPQSWNGYAYSNNAPTNGSDSTGMYCDGCQQDASEGAAGAAAAAATDDIGCSADASGNCRSQQTVDAEWHREGWAHKAGNDLPPITIVKKFQPKYPTINQMVNFGEFDPNLTFEQNVEIYFRDRCSFDITQNGCVDLQHFYDHWSAVQSIPTNPCNSISLCRSVPDMLTVLLSDPEFYANPEDAAFGGCFNSFPGQTQVLRADTLTEPISAIKIGDTVLATNPLTGQTQAEKVTDVIKTLTDTEFTDLVINTITGPQKLTSTQHHPYWDVTAQRWTNAADLHAGDRLREPDGRTVTIARVRNYVGHVVTYNLTVANLHTYYVLAGTTPILVHNTGPDCRIPVGGKNGDALGDEDFHGSDYSLDEIVGFVNGHTGDANPAMGRPTEAQIETTLRQAGPVQLAGQNSSRFDYEGVRVIVNWNTPWKSTAYYPGK